MSQTDSPPDWPSLLTSIRIPFSTHGKNVGRNHVNIQCCWCGNADPSMHLSISTVSPTFFCQRNPSHKGGHRPGLVRLLMQLGVERDTASKLLDAHYAPSTNAVIERTGMVQNAVTKLWDKFSPAIENHKIMDYLKHERGFPDPHTVAIKYNLRFAPHGLWAGRVLFPFIQNNTVVSWTGRSFMPHLSPKYKMADVVNEQGLIYTGRSARRLCVIVEGPMDALKINAACELLPISAVALTGLAVSEWSAPSPSRWLRINNYLEPASIRLLALDKTVDVFQVIQIKRVLTAFRDPDYITPASIPEPFGDPGEMSYDAIKTWLTAYLVKGNAYATETNIARPV